jgi:hypothetical protein
MDFGTGGGKRPGTRIRAGKTEHLMARFDKFLNDGRADESGGPGYKDTHMDLLLFMVGLINFMRDNVATVSIVVNAYILKCSG